MDSQPNTTSQLESTEETVQIQEYLWTVDKAFDKTMQALTSQKDCFGSLYSADGEKMNSIKQSKDEYDNRNAVMNEEDKHDHNVKQITSTLIKFTDY